MTLPVRLHRQGSRMEYVVHGCQDGQQDVDEVVLKAENMARLKYVIEGDPWDPNVSPFGGEAAYLHERTGNPIGLCRDAVILRYLVEGDVGPLAATFAQGISPGPELLRYVASMMAPEDWCKEGVPFAFKLKNRSGKEGARSQPENDWRDLRISEIMEIEKKKITKGDRNLKYEAAAEIVSEFIGAGKDTVKAAYNSRHSKRRKIVTEAFHRLESCRRSD